MYDFHKDRKRYFDIQFDNANEYVLPFIESTFKIQPGMRVLEIGCGEAGVLKAFLDRGCFCLGVEFDLPRIDNARAWLADEVKAGKIDFITKDIHLTSLSELGGLFDIIILKDVIEHIFDQPKLFLKMKEILKPEGVIFFGFPPWQMPFGGHQQICEGKWMSKIPYYHLLPRSIYKWILQKNNENVSELLEIYDTRISIERFEKITKQTGFHIMNKLHFLINPIYKWKFNLKARKQFPFITKLPWIRNFFTTCVYYLITPK